MVTFGKSCIVAQCELFHLWSNHYYYFTNGYLPPGYSIPLDIFSSGYNASYAIPTQEVMVDTSED